jgi:hypothetical protein
VQSLLLHFYLLEGDGLSRALSSAGAALKTCIRIDHVLVGTLGDGFHGALSSAAAALHAIISNKVCHLMYLLFYLLSIFLTNCIVTHYLKKSTPNSSIYYEQNV